MEVDPPRRVRTGPRHAAPKKSVLTRLQVPAGKAIALAAMPTAVLMGMGLTPQLAQANPRAEDRFKAGPCVTRPDDEAKKDDADDDKKDKDKTEDDKADKADKSEDGKSGKAGDGDEPGASPSPSASDEEKKPSGPSSGSGDDASDDASSKKPEDSSSPSPSESDDDKDPLGLGKLLGGLLGGGKSQDDEQAKPSEPSATPSPSASKSSQGSGDAKDEEAGDGGEKATDPVKDTVDKVGKGLKDTADKAKEKAEEAKEKAEDAKPTPSPSASATGADGKEGYPCPTHDAEAYDNAPAEATDALLPDDPWTLKSTKLTLHGLKYDGIVEVKTYGGQTKKVLKFRASGVDIKDLHQLVKGPMGAIQNVEGAPGSTSTIRDGEVTMYTESLSGNLLGLIPITFTPEFPPPLTLPELFFTNVEVKQAGQFGGTLTIPGMHAYRT